MMMIIVHVRDICLMLRDSFKSVSWRWMFLPIASDLPQKPVEHDVDEYDARFYYAIGPLGSAGSAPSKHKLLEDLMVRIVCKLHDD
jgi:hypothetical protein